VMHGDAPYGLCYLHIQTLAEAADFDGTLIREMNMHAKNTSTQTFTADIEGNAPCASHTECDAIIMDDAKISATPQIKANDLDAALIHEASIGRIAGEQLIKLMTLGLSQEEAEEQIIAGFLR